MTRLGSPTVLLLLATCAVAPAPASAQDDAWDEEPGVRLSVKLDWPLFFLGGAGGALGVEFDHFEVGAMGFATPLIPYYRDLFLQDASQLEVPLNWGAEVFVQWFPERSRRWLFVGGLVSVDGFDVRSEGGGATETLIAVYVAPRVGFRIPLGTDYLYFEPSIGAALRVYESQPTVSSTVVRTQPIAPITFLSLGGSIPLQL